MAQRRLQVQLMHPSLLQTYPDLLSKVPSKLLSMLLLKLERVLSKLVQQELVQPLYPTQPSLLGVPMGQQSALLHKLLSARPSVPLLHRRHYSRHLSAGQLCLPANLVKSLQ